ncbi:MAG: pentapeptide repeat-containing protein [Acidobacteriia bacterium]|nr:pentapeptide repeat-containing protein [Terriglobia bacterium]MYF80009.1 pentapeptide repeat-containing protein [Chloroflexota bacterium]MYK11993.1 pentapeptide repeat-containing protein [Terriglobia bacterium]
MTNEEHLNILRKGADGWNAWRVANRHVRPDLRGVNFEEDVRLGSGVYDLPDLSGFDFSGCDLHGIAWRNSIIERCNFDDCVIDSADLCFSNFLECTFRGTSMRVTRIGSASFEECVFEDADLAYCSAEETSFKRSRISGSSLNHVQLVKADLSDVVLHDTSVYGISAWDLELEGAKQSDLLISDDGPNLTVDSVEVAQFISLLVMNSKIRGVIDTIISRVVLILGSFNPERKPTLHRIRDLLRKRGYVSVLFDFEGPEHRDLTETVRTLAHLSRFVFVDLTDPSSVPHELQSVVPDLPSLPVQPLILSGSRPYGMFEHTQRYPWVLDVQEYDPASLEDIVVRSLEDCERKVEESRKNS